MTEYEFWRERETHEVWAIEFVDGVVTGLCGPLPHCDIDEAFLDSFAYSPERAAWVEEHRDAFELCKPVGV